MVPPWSGLVSTDIRMIPGKINGATLPLPDGIATWASGSRNTGGYTDYITSITQRGKTNSSNPSNCSDVLIGYFNPLLSSNPNCTFVDGLTFMIVNGSIGNEFAADDPAGDPALNSAEWFRINFDFQNFGLQLAGTAQPQYGQGGVGRASAPHRRRRAPVPSRPSVGWRHRGLVPFLEQRQSAADGTRTRYAHAALYGRVRYNGICSEATEVIHVLQRS